MSRVAHQAGAYPSFCSMKRLGVFLLPLHGMQHHCKVTPSSKFASIHSDTWVERGTIRLKCLAQEHNTISAARVQKGNTCNWVKLTMRSLCIPKTVKTSLNLFKSKPVHMTKSKQSITTLSRTKYYNSFQKKTLGFEPSTKHWAPSSLSASFLWQMDYLFNACYLVSNRDHLKPKTSSVQLSIKRL